MLQIGTNGLHGPTKNKKAAYEPVWDSHAADRGYAAETRP